MLTKDKVLQAIQGLPNEFSLDELVEKLILLEKIEIGLRQIKEGKVITYSVAKQKLNKQLK